MKLKRLLVFTLLFLLASCTIILPSPIIIIRNEYVPTATLTNTPIATSTNTATSTSTPTLTPTKTPTVTPSLPITRISYNINGEAVPSVEYMFQIMSNPCKTTALFMNNLGFAIRLKQLCPNTIVMHRAYSVLEGDEWFYRSPQNMINQWNLEGSKEIVRYTTNEPSYGAGNIAQFINNQVELMRLARLNGITLVVGNFAVGNFRAEDINNGSYDSFLRAINQYNHYLGLHEYTTVALPFGVGQWNVNRLLDRTQVQVASWPLASAIPVRLWSGELPPYWHLRRGDWFLLRADYLGIQRPKIILTEFGWDNLSDVKQYIEPLRNQFGIDKYFRDMRGVNTYVNVWRWYWPNWSFATAACEQLKWANRIYPPDYIGFNLFTWSTNPHWLHSDYSGRENTAHLELHQCLKNE